MGSKELIESIAKITIATVFGGPIGGARTASNQAVDLLTKWISRGEKSKTEELMEHIRIDLGRLAIAEHISEPQLESAFLAAEAMIAMHSPSASEIIDLNLRPDAVAEKVLDRGSQELALLDETEEHLCRRILSSVYRNLLADPAALPQIESAFRRAVLTRLDEIEHLPMEVADALRKVLASAILYKPTRPWRADIYPPSAMLRAEFGIVPFYGRQAMIAEIGDWCDEERWIGVRLYTAAGGMGKTRLLIEVCRRLSQKGWQTGFLQRDVRSSYWQPLDSVFDQPGLKMIVVDYAETRRQEIKTLIKNCLERPPAGKVRLVLLARAASDWWHDLRLQSGGVGDLLSGPATSEHKLPPLAVGLEERREVFLLATESFSSALGKIPPEIAPPSLDADHYDRVLFLHMSALAGVMGVSVENERDLLDFSLNRERLFWDEGMQAMDLQILRGRPVAQAAALLTLSGGTANREEAVRIISRAPLLMDQSKAVIERVAELFHRLYPGENWMVGVQPDLLGEHLIGRMIEEDPNLLGVFGHVQ